MTMGRPALDPIAREIWAMKYRYRSPDGLIEETAIEDTWRRVANAAAAAEPEHCRTGWAQSFYDCLEGYRFLPGGRILAGAGTSRQVTLFNCFVMGRIPDSLDGIFTQLREAALTMQQGGGIGHDFSPLRPSGAPVAGVDADASGSVSFMEVWDAMCSTIMSAGTRRGAMMGTMRCDHPDIEAFIAAKQQAGKLKNFNLSVLVTDDFMAAVKAQADWPLIFDGKIYRTVPAASLWDAVMRSCYECAEPGVIFIDRINSENNLSYCETISATNPCGEQPLPAYGACLLGSLNLTQFIIDPFSKSARLDEAALGRTTAIGVRFLDNVISISRYPLNEQREQALAKRRIGLGMTGLADALAMCGLIYGSSDAVDAASHWTSLIETAAYKASIVLAKERGPFPMFDAQRYGNQGHAANLHEALRSDIARYGIRNGLLMSIAPTGTISLLAGNVSSGIEPIFSVRYQRKLLYPDGSCRMNPVHDYAAALYWHMFGKDERLPPSFITADELAPSAHLRMQAAVQKHVDGSISKTINISSELPFVSFRSIYQDAYDMGLKGCTVFRPNPVTGAVLSRVPAARPHVTQLMDPFSRDREDVIPGATYKLDWPGNDSPIHVTINDVIEDGTRRPFEIFINPQDRQLQLWATALARTLSAVFRRSGDLSYITSELKTVADPRGGHWIEGGHYSSQLAAVGGAIDRHILNLSQGTQRQPSHGSGSRDSTNLLPCPQCQTDAMTHQEGCAACLSCGYTRCN
jgi:ribonucleoside-diphosphate reductase alpha chain